MCGAPARKSWADGRFPAGSGPLIRGPVTELHQIHRLTNRFVALGYILPLTTVWARTIVPVAVGATGGGPMDDSEPK